MKQSLITKITIFFAIASVLVCALFITFSRIQINKALGYMQANQINSINYLLNLYENENPPSDIEQYFATFGLKLVKDKNLALNVISHGEKIFTKPTPLGEFQSIKYLNGLFLNIKNESFMILFEGDGAKNINDPLWIGFFLTASVLISLYISILRSFAPLKKLSKEIKKFGSGNLDVASFDISRKDEIGQVAHEFDAAASKIRELIRSRQLFLRTIMHELKTPIGKGRIISEMVDDETQKSRLVSVFERLEILIEEFAKIEQLLSKSYALKFEDYYFGLILEQVKDITMLDDFDNKVSVEMDDNVKLHVDFQLFCLAIKNLIDNGLKYSDDKRVKIICDNERITVCNLGKPLVKSFEHYKQAFIRNKNEKASGMGLGLYIIDKICEMHKFKFDHAYGDGKHYFSIIFKNIKR